MHEIGVGLGLAHERGGHLVGGHRLEPVGRLGLLAHAHPHIGVDHIGAGHGLARVGGVLVAACPAVLGEERLHGGTRLVTFRSAHGNLHAEVVGAEEPGVGHVAAGVPQERHLAPAQRVEQVAALGPALGQREGVGVDLAGVEQVGEGVDHGHRAPLGQLLDLGLVEGAHDQSVHVTGKHPRGIGDALTAAELDVVLAEEKRIATQLMDTDFEGDAGARAGLGEDHRPGLPGKHRGPLGGAEPFELLRRVEHGPRLRGGEVGLLKEVHDRGKTDNLPASPRVDEEKVAVARGPPEMGEVEAGARFSGLKGR